MRTLPTFLCLPLLVTLVSCNNDEDEKTDEPTPEMEQAVAAMNDAFAASLLSADMMKALSDTNDRARTKGAPCPEITRSSTNLTLDYGTGCIPTSGLVPEPVAGIASFIIEPVDRSASAIFKGLSYAGATVNGTFMASYSVLGGEAGLDVEEYLDIEFQVGADNISALQALTLGIRATFVSATGNIDYTDPGATFAVNVDSVEFYYEDLAGECPLPRAGTVTVVFDGNTVSIAFNAETPTTGMATVTFGEHTAELDICSYMAYL